MGYKFIPVEFFLKSFWQFTHKIHEFEYEVVHLLMEFIYDTMSLFEITSSLSTKIISPESGPVIDTARRLVAVIFTDSPFIFLHLDRQKEKYVKKRMRI